METPQVKQSAKKQRQQQWHTTAAAVTYDALHAVCCVSYEE